MKLKPIFLPFLMRSLIMLEGNCGDLACFSRPPDSGLVKTIALSRVDPALDKSLGQALLFDCDAWLDKPDQLPEFRDNGYRVGIEVVPVLLGKSSQPDWESIERKALNGMNLLFKGLVPFQQSLWSLYWFQGQAGFLDKNPADAENLGFPSAPRVGYFEFGAGYRAFRWLVTRDSQCTIGGFISGMLPESYKTQPIPIWLSLVAEISSPLWKCNLNLDCGANNLQNWFRKETIDFRDMTIHLVDKSKNFMLKKIAVRPASMLSFSMLGNLYQLTGRQSLLNLDAGVRARYYFGITEKAFIGQAHYTQRESAEIKQLTGSGSMNEEAVDSGYKLDFMLHWRAFHWLQISTSVPIFNGSKKFDGLELKFSFCQRPLVGFQPSPDQQKNMYRLHHGLGNRLQFVHHDPQAYRFLIQKEESKTPK